MAISTTYNKKQEELAKNQSAVSSNKAYNGMSGVSQNTANNLGNYQQGYQQSQQAQAANDYLNQIQAQKPQTYNSKYGEQLNALLQQIQNPKDFKYDFNGDELFKSYADLYMQQGKQAAMDVQGQAAGLTGGYGNSYGQQVGQQQYQQHLLSLYDKGMDLRDRAYQAYQDKLAGAKDAYGLTAQAEATDYDRYQDQLANWQNERAYAAERADTEYNRDYNQYQQDLQYWTGLAQNEAQQAEAQRQYEQNFAENQRQFDASMAQSAEQFEKTTKLNYDKLAQDQAQFDANLTEQQRQYNRNLAIDYVSNILANGQIPSNELLTAAGLSYEDAMKLIAQVTGGTGGNKKGDTGDGTVYYQDTDGSYYKYHNGERKTVPESQVTNDDLIHNEYIEVAQRRQSNKQDATKEWSVKDVLADWIKRGVNKSITGGK